jgi:hypothetical protein
MCVMFVAMLVPGKPCWNYIRDNTMVTNHFSVCCVSLKHQIQTHLEDILWDTLVNQSTTKHFSTNEEYLKSTYTLLYFAGVRPYKCIHCDYSAIQSSSYKNHMKLMHPDSEALFACSMCTYVTVSEDNYVRHISDHMTGL